MQSKIDDLDYKLLAELRINSRLSIPSLATILGVSRGTVKASMDRLLADGTIAGFTVRLRDEASEGMITGIMLVELAGRNTKGLTAALRKLPGLNGLYTTNGVWDLVAQIEVPTMSEFNRVVTTVRNMEGVGKSETHLLLGPA